MKVCLFIKSAAFQMSGWKSSGYCRAPSLSNVLGAWFNVFPFSLQELCGSIQAEEVEAQPREADGKRYISVPPFVLNASEYRGASDKISIEMKNAVSRHNDVVKSNLFKFSLNSSSASDLVGGVCLSGVGLAGVLKGYCREMFAEHAFNNSDVSANRSWIERDAGICSYHRKLRHPAKQIRRDPTRKETGFDSYLRNDDSALARSNLYRDAAAIMKNTESFKGMMDHLENLHHASVPFVDGLTVELLEFQRQSVQWALERETTPGGVQSFLWAKLPAVAEPGQDIYFNPILECFRKDKPRLVRGGIIAEEMGLGKTVISLALILQNPAPKAPLSGSPVSALDSAGTASDATPWDKELYSRTSGSNSKRGSILSRGTLVVVSYYIAYHIHPSINELQSMLTTIALFCLAVPRFAGGSMDRRGSVQAQGSRSCLSLSWTESQAERQDSCKEFDCRYYVPDTCFGCFVSCKEGRG